MLLSINRVPYARTKHIKIDYHFVRKQATLQLEIRYISRIEQLAYIFTKPQIAHKFMNLVYKLGLPDPKAQGW